MSEVVKLGADEKFCSSCGNVVKKEAEICVKCGVRLSGSAAGGKNWTTTLLLCLFAGYFGAHRFYSGSIGIGIAQLLTAGGCGLWWLIDLIMILTGSYKDEAGKPLVK